MKRMLLILALAISTSAAVAQPTMWPVGHDGNNHYYEYVVDPGRAWAEADYAAVNRTWDGLRGHLVTLTTEAEYNWVVKNIWELCGGGRVYLGGYQDIHAADYREPDGGWRWVTGEPFEYTRWAAAEPNNDKGAGENFLQCAEGPQMLWNDTTFNSDGMSRGYIVEYE